MSLKCKLTLIRDSLKKSTKYIKDDDINFQIENVIKRVENYNDLGFSIVNLYPIEDRINLDADMCFLPNLDSFLNIVAAIRNLRITKGDKIYVY